MPPNTGTPALNQRHESEESKHDRAGRGDHRQAPRHLVRIDGHANEDRGRQPETYGHGERSPFRRSTLSPRTGHDAFHELIDILAGHSTTVTNH